MKILRVLLRILGIILLLILMIGMFVYFRYNEPLPQGKDPQSGDQLARKMLNAINHTAWDSTNWVQWSFPGGHHYVWDKRRNLVQVSWKDYKVLLNPEEVNGTVFQHNQLIEKGEKQIQQAWTYFCNDSFWLNAPAKVFDPGTVRKVVAREDGRPSLLVSYSSGGVTPGDSYLWHLDEKGMPVSFQMWVSVIPIGGMKASWEEWITLAGGAKISTLHKNGLLSIPIKNLRSGQVYEDLGVEKDPFSALVQP